MPELLPAAGEIDGLSNFEGFLQGFLIHPGQHEGFLGLGVDGDGRHEAIRVELWAEIGGLVSGVACAHGEMCGQYQWGRPPWRLVFGFLREG